MTGSTYIDFEKASYKGMQLITKGENPNFGLLIICGINLGLRMSDLLSLTFDQLKQESFTIEEGKTGKTRKLMVNEAIRIAVSNFQEDPVYHLDGKPFTSQKGSVYSIQHVNRLIKKYFKGDRISSHSLRKSFGRRVWENNGCSEKALEQLNLIFGHSTQSMTKRYLGIQQQELDNIYINL